MRIALVADGDLPRYPDCSRDPDVLAAGLRSLGHTVTMVPAYLPADPGPAPAADVVVSLGRAAPPVAAVLAEAAGSPLVACLPAGIVLPAQAVAAAYGRLVCRHLPAACLLVDFPRHQQAAQQLGADRHRVFVVPPGMSLTEPATGAVHTPAVRTPLRVLCDASRTALADQQFLARVLLRLQAKRGRTIRTVVITSPSDDASSARIRSVWEGHDAPPAVVHSVDGEAAAELYRSSDVVVVPSGDSDATITMLRAMAAARAVLASDSAHIRDVASSVRHGVLARQGQEKEWIDKLDYLLDETALRSHLGRSARARVENGFSLSHTLRCLDDRLSAVTTAWRYVVPPDPSASLSRPI